MSDEKYLFCPFCSLVINENNINLHKECLKTVKKIGTLSEEVLNKLL